MDKTPALDPYHVLGLSHEAGQDEIDAAYTDRTRRLEQLTAPPEKLAEGHQRLDLAYATLSDPKHRRNYDRYGKMPAPGEWQNVLPEKFITSIQLFFENTLPPQKTIAAKLLDRPYWDTTALSLSLAIALLTFLIFFQTR